MWKAGGGGRGEGLRAARRSARVALAERDALAIFGLTFLATVFQSNVESITRMPRASLFSRRDSLNTLILTGFPWLHFVIE